MMPSASQLLCSAALVAALALCLTSCGTGESYLVFRGETMGTTYTVKVMGRLDKTRAEKTEGIIAGILQFVNDTMSTYQPDSALSEFNAREATGPFQTYDAMADVFEISLKVHEQSRGAFDITVGPLVNAWGFGPEARSNPPDEVTIAALRERVGSNMLSVVDRETIAKSRADVYCDLSAVAKGYAVDLVAEALENEPITSYMVEVGGEVRAKGVNPDGEPWRLGVEKPLEGVRELATVVSLRDCAMATSGDYRNFYELDGKRYSHTIDPRTGYPVQHMLASVTVLHPECVWADAYATALMVLGPEEGLALAEELGLAVYMLVREGEAFKEVVSSAWLDYRATE